MKVCENFATLLRSRSLVTTPVFLVNFGVIIIVFVVVIVVAIVTAVVFCLASGEFQFTCRGFTVSESDTAASVLSLSLLAA